MAKAKLNPYEDFTTRKLESIIKCATHRTCKETRKEITKIENELRRRN